MKRIPVILLFLCFLLAGAVVRSQDSTAGIIVDSAVLLKAKVDRGSSAKHIPRKAVIRSAILPGWGQAYNKKYWKIPIIYGALGATGYVFFDNITTYREVRYAYRVSVESSTTGDTSQYASVAEYLKPFVRANATGQLRNYRDITRRNIDYSVLVFLLFWGLNVVDATVDAHLKDFDVSPNLSMKVKPMLPTGGSVAGYASGNTSGQGGIPMTGLSLVVDIHKARPRVRSLPVAR